MISFFPTLSIVRGAIFASIAIGAPAASAFPSANGTLSTYQCTDLPTWSASDFQQQDCYAALASHPFTEDVVEYGDDLVEFYSGSGGDIPPRTSFPPIAVPRKYTFNSCTLTIAMVRDFKFGDLPGLDPSRLKPRHDVSSYQTISTVGHFLLDRCIYIEQPGWYAVGKRDAIGVFLWATGSVIDKKISAVNSAANIVVSSELSQSINGTDLEVNPLGKTSVSIS